MKLKIRFTKIELMMVVFLIIISLLALYLVQSQIETVTRDRQRKIAINTLHQTLQEVYLPAKGHYPKKLDEKSLPTVDSVFFIDPNGIQLGDQQSDYSYRPLGCVDNSCKSYILRANLENEVDYVRKPGS